MVVVVSDSLSEKLFCLYCCFAWFNLKLCFKRYVGLVWAYMAYSPLLALALDKLTTLVLSASVYCVHVYVVFLSK